MKKLLSTTILFSISCFLFSQQGFIKGTVSDSKTKETLIGVRVILDDTTGTVTDVFGNYLIKTTAGKHKLEFKFIGVKNQKHDIDVPANDTLKLSPLMEGESKQLDVVVVSAGRFEQKIGEVTVSMEVIKPALIENKGLQSLEDAMDYVPGMNVVDGQANIRGGAGFSYAAGSRVLLVVDDMPMLSADAADIRWSFLPIENLEQVEVMKGASSALFGSSAMNGVIHFRTGYAKEDPITKVNVTMGMYDKPIRKELVWWQNGNPTYSGMNFFHARKIKQLDFVIGGNIYNDEGYKYLDKTQRYRLNTNWRYRFKKIEGLSAGLNLNINQNKNGMFVLWAGPDSALVPSGAKIDQNVSVHFTIDPFIVYNNAKNNTKHTLRARMFRKDVRNPKSAGNNTTTATFSDLYYSEYQFQKRFKNNLTWTTGVVYIYSLVRSPGLFGTHFSNNLALFSQFDKKIGNRLNLSFGIRGEYFKTDSIETRENINLFFDEAKPIAKQSPIKPVMRAGLNYQLFDFTYLRSSFGQGYRFPSIAERFVRTSNGGIEVYPNANLNPETGWTAEIGIKQGLALGSWKGFLDVAGFISEYNGMMEFTFGQYGDPIKDPMFGTGFQSKNVGNTRITGYEVSLMGQGKMGNIDINALIGYTYIDPHQTNFIDSINGPTTTTGTDLLKYRYQHTAKGDIEFIYKKISAGLSLRANSFMENIDIFFEDPYFFPGMKEYREKHNKGDYMIDFRFACQVHEKMKASFIINNLLNREVMGRPADILPQRVFALQLSTTF